LHRRDQPFEHLLADLAREIRIEGRPSTFTVVLACAVAGRHVQFHKLGPYHCEAGRQPLRLEDVHRGIFEHAVLEPSDNLGTLADLQTTGAGHMNDRQEWQRRGGHPSSPPIAQPARAGMDETPYAQPPLAVVPGPHDRAWVVSGRGEHTELLSIEGPRVRELEAVQALRGSSLGRKDLRSTQCEPERDGLLLLAQEACLVAHRERLFENTGL
jgi:hypothetical protein